VIGANSGTIFYVYNDVTIKEFFMQLRILVISDNMQYARADIQMLKERGIQVYTCGNYHSAADMVTEVKPDLIFLDPQQPGKNATELYHALLDNILFARIPLVYALVEDDVYLVDRKRTASKASRNAIADNIIDAIRLALSNPKPKHQPAYIHSNKIHIGGNYAARA
jgi:CheY-like chemotaxis protein